MIIFNKLSWSNCFSYGDDNSIDLDSDRLTQILGVNGSGKSSIPLILEEGLFNKNSKGIKKAEISNRYLDEPYEIEVVFTVGTDVYVARVERAKTLKAYLSCNGEDISSHTASNTFKQIESILGIEYKTFSQLVYQNTSSSLAFLTATDTERKKFLIELLDLEKYLEYFEKFKEVSKELNAEKIKLDTQVETHKKWLESNTLKGLEVLDIPICTVDTSVEEEQKASIKQSIANIESTNKRIKNNNFYKKQLKAMDLSKYSNIPIHTEHKYDKEQNDVGRLENTIDACEKAIKKLSKLSGTCPTCSQEVDQDFINNLISEQYKTQTFSEKEVERLNNIIEKRKADNKLLKEKLAAEKEFEELIRSVDDSLPENLFNENDLKADLSRVEKILEEKKEEIESISKEILRRERHNTRISVIKEQTDSIKSELSKSEKNLLEVQKVFGNVEILKKAFSPNGLIAYKIENLIKDLEDLVNTYLADLSDGRFSLIFVTEKDKLNVELTDNGLKVDINTLSSGELARVNTATLLAIRKLMNSLSKTQINILFLDEVVSVLDEMGKDKLVEILSKEEGLNTFLVSHGWQHPLLTKLEVVKEDEISRVDNAN